jgi:hypothetical protein
MRIFVTKFSPKRSVQESHFILSTFLRLKTAEKQLLFGGFSLGSPVFKLAFLRWLAVEITSSVLVVH